MSFNITTYANGSLSLPFAGVEALFIPTDGLTGFNRNNNTGYGNLTVLENHDLLCNTTLCDLTLAPFDYVPSLGGNVLYAAIFGIYIVCNVYLGIRHRAWGYLAAMVLGLAGEVVGYIGRILLNQDIFDPSGNNFLLYLVPLTIAPALLSAAVYLCLARIIVVYGEHLSRFRPRTYTLIFCSCDVFSLVLQAAGGGIASGANSPSQNQTGVNIMIAGLSFQVVSIALFAVCCAEFAFRLWKSPQSWSMEHASLYESRLFKAFLAGLCAATLTIFIRSCFRVAELSGGFHGPLANNQISFMILEGAMIIIASSCLTLLHPGITFQGFWSAANFSFRAGKNGRAEKTITTEEGRGETEEFRYTTT